MPRSVRLQYAGAVYHVMCRGDRQEAIFADDADRELFLGTLAEVCVRTGFLVHSYVLMNNHYHLLLETPEPNLVAGMRWFQGTYTARLNARHRLRGHVFQGRYKAIPVEAEDNPEYFRVVSDYIHLNPARAGLLPREKADIAAYRWSSLPALAGLVNGANWLFRGRVFAALRLKDEGHTSRRRFLDYMRERAAEVVRGQTRELQQEWNGVRRGWYLGGNAFCERLQALADQVVSGHRRVSYEDRGLTLHDERQAERWLSAALPELGLNMEELQGLKQSDPRKQAVGWLLKTKTTVPVAWICQRLAMGDASNVRRAALVFRRAPNREIKKLKARILHICRD